MNTEPFRNGLVERRNRTLRASRKSGTGPKCSELMMRYLFWACNMNLYIHLCDQISFFLFLVFLSWKKIWFFVSAGINALMPLSDGLGPYFSCRKTEKTRPMSEEMDGEVFISRQSRHFSLIHNMVKLLFSVCTLNWRVNKYVSYQGEV